MQNLQFIIENLNAPQREAVEHLDGPLLVLAGAGTGKTRVLTTRLANLLQSGKAGPANILAVTFTNKAAKEMAERVEHLLGTSTAGMWLGTFHSLGARILRRYAERVGLRPDFTILDTDDQKRLLTQLLQEANIDATANPPRLLAAIISKWKDNAWLPQDVPQSEDGFAARQGIGLYARYQERLKALNAVDFGDLLLLPLKLLQNNLDILARFHDTITHILVDEYQDTNNVQYLWLRLVSQASQNICVVGDDDQSIYGWRGAQVGNILRFEKDFPGAKVVRLEQNYRSTGNILTAASGLIAKNAERHSKTLWTSDTEGEPVHVHPMLDDREESRFIAEYCQSHMNGGGNLADCAVLVRTSAQTRQLEEQFIKTGVPYVVVGGLKFYERKEIRDALAYLKLIHNVDNDLAYQRIINVPRRGVGDGALQTLQEIAREQNTNLFNATQYAVMNDRLSGKAKNALARFVDLMTVWQNFAASFPPDKLLEQVLEESGYAQMLRDDKDPDAKTRIDNLKELLRALQDYADLGSFLEHVALVMDGDARSEDSVKLMTIHAAKGLEFKLVFLPGFEDGLFPNQRTLNESGAKGMEEERRLAYVAITRAKEELHITYCAMRKLYGQMNPSLISRFIQELPEDALKFHAPTSTVMGDGYGGGSYGGNGYGTYSSRPQVGSTRDRFGKTDYAKPREPLMPYVPIEPAEDGWDVGSRVFHQKFGYGFIQRREGSGEMARLYIAFDKAGTKTLVASLANLQAA